MKKEIKFRGKEVNSKIWVYGGYFQSSEEEGLVSYIFDSIEGAISVIESSVCEFSGFTDRYNTDIYQRDLLEDKDGKNFLVDIRNGCWMAIHEPSCGSEREGECKSDYLYMLKDLEIIGTLL